MIEILTNFLAFIGGASVVTGLAAWIAKVFVSHNLQKKLIDYEAARAENTKLLESKLNESLEVAKAALEISTKAQEVKFEKLHEQRADFMAKLYYELQKTMLEQQALFVIFDPKHPVIPEEDELDTISLHLEELEEFFLLNCLFLSKDLAKMIKELIDQSKASVSKVLWAKRMSKDENEIRAVFTEEAAQQMKSNAFQIQIMIEEEFRKILGVTP